MLTKTARPVHRRYPGSNIDDAFDRNVLLKAPSDAAPPVGSDVALNFAGGRTSAVDIRLNPKFETRSRSSGRRARSGRRSCGPTGRDTSATSRPCTRRASATQLKWQKSEDDELLQEGFYEAVSKGEIIFRIVDKLVKRLYSEPMIEDRVLYLQITLPAVPSLSGNWRLNHLRSTLHFVIHRITAWLGMASNNHFPPPMRPLERPYNYVSRALTAASYPLRGIYYFLRHPSYYPLFLGRLLPLSLLSLLVYLILFTFAFLPQLAFLYIFQGRSAWLNAIVLVLGEGLVIIQGLFEGFFVDECRVDVFDATLIDKGLTDLVAPHRIIYPDAANSVKMLGKPSTAAVYQPWSLIQIVELIVFLPLNLIPYMGTPAFIIITGARLGTFAHYRWFKLRGLTRKERKAEIRSRMWEYTWFGTVAMLLELVPILSFLFLLTSATGAALWTAKLEEQKRRHVAVSGDAAPVSSQGHEPDEPPPPYEDDPV
ncbi:hypothetical protein DL766_008381 [Monosporascus sp. MC13-8B]|uniref:Uncharacterized protein n=1 Tax=Monosporascus cannonballus TaxID=155416 RepID=A0ABY0H615_9PEZI|nr:hypothetical protein DL762_005385 [Monosporascus cannonballus]RYP00636.1 hypothetical protein DL763_000690 [Monosporascus cannonballus]RYP19703.1 hypothetical protein DL766_008381 [Monosporascus sp. MC13-8B]